MISYIMDQLPTNEVIEGALRQQLKIYPRHSYSGVYRKCNYSPGSIYYGCRCNG